MQEGFVVHKNLPLIYLGFFILISYQKTACTAILCSLLRAPRIGFELLTRNGQLPRRQRKIAALS